MSDKDKLNTDQTPLPELTPESINMPSVTEMAQTTIMDEMLTEKETLEAVEGELEELKDIEDEGDDLDKKTYVKISSTFYVKAAGTEKKKNEEGDEVEVEFFKVLNPETNEVERRELDDDEKKEIIVHELKESRRVFNPIKHNGNKTTNQFGNNYKQKRKRRNSLTKKSRKANR